MQNGIFVVSCDSIPVAGIGIGKESGKMIETIGIACPLGKDFAINTLGKVQRELTS